jgi:preprotein translocase subunit SecF
MKRVIHFTKIRFLMMALSISLLVIGLISVSMQGGFNLGIDFQPGLTQRVQIDPEQATANTQSVREALSEIPSAQVQRIGDPGEQEFQIEVRDSGQQDDFVQTMSARVLSEVRAAFGEEAVVERGNSYVGPRFSRDLTRQALVLTGLAMGLILLYIWFRFRLGYALSAVAAIAHDMAFMLAFIGAFQLEVSTATIAALLTVVGYSLNDTIVVFDRIRENETILRESTFEQIINTSITQSLSRTVITSVTTLLAVSAIYIFATGVIEAFALKLIVGIIIGTYSSIFIASPVLLGFRRTVKKRQRQKELEKYGRTAVSEKGETTPAAAAAAQAGAAPTTTAPAASGNQSGQATAKSQAPDAQQVKQQLGKRKQPAGKNVPRSKRKKKKK